MKKFLCKAVLTPMLCVLLALVFVLPACAQNRTFEDYVPYALRTFLTGYNLIAFEDVSMDIHCMGGVIIGGDFTTGDWTGFADGQNLPPSFVGGYVSGAQYNSRNATNNAPLYVGSSNKVAIEWGQYKLNGKNTGNNGQTPVYVNDQFINMEEVFTAIVTTAEKLRAQCSPHTLHLTGGNANIAFGNAVTIKANEIPLWESSHGNIYFTGNPAQKVNTVITIEGSGSVKMPTVWVNGAQISATEMSNVGTSVIWYLPNATRVDLNSAPWLGHIIAPNAHITMGSGNYNGCLIGRSIDIGSEGHLFNYNANDLPEPTPEIHITPSPTPKATPTPNADSTPGATPTPNATPTPKPQELKSYPLNLMVHKTVVKDNMPENVKNMPWSFTFELKAETANAPMPGGAKGGTVTTTVTSNDPVYLGESAARFEAITYTAAGTYVYTLRELEHDQNYFSHDQTVYTITVNVAEHSNHQLVAFPSYSKNGIPVNHADYINYFLYREWRDDTIELKGSIQLDKIDANTRKPLAGSVFGLYSDPNCEKLYATMPATDADGRSVLHGLARGTYYLREKTPLEGYGISHTVYPVTVVPGYTVTANNGKPIENIPGSGSVTLTKAVENAGTNEEFPFIIKLSKKDISNVYVIHNGTRCFATSHDLAHDGEALVYLGHGEKMVLSALPTGTEVYISELTTGLEYEVTVNGEKRGSFSTTIGTDTHESAAFVNTVVLETPTRDQIDSMPATGDNQHIMLWGLLCAASAAVLALVRKRAI